MPRTEQAIAGQESALGSRTTRRRVSPAPSAARRRNGVDSLLELHRTRGNAFVARAIQCKLAVSQPNDAFEQEADRVAESVVNVEHASHATGTVARSEETGAAIQRMCSECQEEIGRQVPPTEEEDKKTMAGGVQRQEGPEDEDKLRTKSAGGGGFDVEGDTESGIRALSGGGQSLAAPVRADMESRMGFDFSGVRVHTGGNAAHLARSVNALAFTHGNNVVFGSGQYQPDTPGGGKLLAHELTHVVQQTGGIPRRRAEGERD
jgi:hypothetical protein